MGVDLLQGYLLCRPQDTPPSDARAMLSHIAPAQPGISEDASDLTPLLLEQAAVEQTTVIADVLAAFSAQANLNSMAVLDAARCPVGIVHRYSLSEALLKPFAADLFARKPISRLMNRDFLAVDIGQSLQKVSRLLTSRARPRIAEAFIITR